MESKHSDDVTEAQIQNLLDISTPSVTDELQKCPTCLIQRLFPKGFDNHLSYHLEAFATFSVPRNVYTAEEEDASEADGQSGRAHGWGSEWAHSSHLHFQSPPASTSESKKDTGAELSPIDPLSLVASGQESLSSKAGNQINRCRDKQERYQEHQAVVDWFTPIDYALDTVAQVRKCGLESVLSLPRLVVCGDQSAGKSSVLEALTEIPFPRHDSLCTRFATEIILRRAPVNSLTIKMIPATTRSVAEQSSILSFSGSITDFTQLPKRHGKGDDPYGSGRWFNKR